MPKIYYLLLNQNIPRDLDAALSAAAILISPGQGVRDPARCIGLLQKKNQPVYLPFFSFFIFHLTHDLGSRLQLDTLLLDGLMTMIIMSFYAMFRNLSRTSSNVMAVATNTAPVCRYQQMTTLRFLGFMVICLVARQGSPILQCSRVITQGTASLNRNPRIFVNGKLNFV